MHENPQGGSYGPLDILERLKALNSEISSIQAEINVSDTLPDSFDQDIDLEAFSDDQVVIDLAERNVAVDNTTRDADLWKGRKSNIANRSLSNEDRISNIISFLSLSEAYSFWGIILAMFNIQFSDNIPTACLSYSAGSLTPDIIIGNEMMKHATDKQLAFILIHEVLHYLYLHPWRTKGRDAAASNYAADRIINNEIISTVLGEQIKSGKLNNKKVYSGHMVSSVEGILYITDDICQSGETAADVSFELMYEYEKKKIEEQNNDPNNQSQGQGQGQGSYNPGGSVLDGHDWADITNNISEEEAKEQVKGIVNTAGKMAGNTPDTIQNLIKGFGKNKIKWSNLVSSWVDRTKAGKEYKSSWARPNLLFPDEFPGRVLLPEPKIDVGFDVSGSMSDEDFKECIAETIAISNQNDTWAVQIDTQIKQETYSKFDGDDISNRGISRTGYGGTDMNPVLEFFAEQEDPSSMVIIFTDGWIPEIKEELIYTDTLFVVTSNGTTEYLAPGAKKGLYSVIQIGQTFAI